MSNKFKAAGAVLYSKKTKRYLLVRRSDSVSMPFTWATVGGEIDPGETPEEAVIRELEEEVGYFGRVRLEEVTKFEGGYIYYNFVGYIDEEFEPRLNWENDDFGWYTREQILAGTPKPLHPELHKIRYLVFE